MAAKDHPRKDALERRYEGEEVLSGLLSLSGSPCSTAEAVERIREAQGRGDPPNQVFPSLFNGEPRFPSPDIARRIFQNLFGLWDLIEQGRPWQKPPPRLPRPPKPSPVRPAPFGALGPDPDFVEAAWRYLEDLPDREWTPLSHRFENRQDTLLGWLDATGLSDDGYAVARHLLFELHAMIELGWPAGVQAVRLDVLAANTEGSGNAPEALWAYADEAVFEAEHDDEARLPPEEALKVREVVRRGLLALWNARQE